MFPPNVKLGEADVVLHFETNDMLNAGRFGVILEDIVALARSPDFFGLDVDVRIAELSTGSLTARLTMICSIAASLSAMGSFALALQEHMNSPTDNIGQHVAEMMVDDGVASIDIVTTTHHVQVNRNDNPAVSALEAIREEGGYGTGGYGEGPYGGRSGKSPDQHDILSDGPAAPGKPTSAGAAISNSSQPSDSDTNLPHGSFLMLDDDNDKRMGSLLSGAPTITGRFERTSGDVIFFVSNERAYPVFFRREDGAPPVGRDFRLTVEELPRDEDEPTDNPPRFKIIFLEPA